MPEFDKFINGDPATLNLGNKHMQYIEFYHFASRTKIRFKAFLTEYTENFTSNWNSVPVYGRMDPIQIFQNTERKISLGWEAVAEERREAGENLSRAQLLTQMLYPAYNGSGGATAMSASPLMKLKFMNLIGDASVWFPNKSVQNGGLIGAASGLTWTPIQEEGWVMSGDTKGALYPRTVTFAMQFTILHSHALGFDHNTGDPRRGFGNFPFGRTIYPAGRPRTRAGRQVDANRKALKSDCGRSDKELQKQARNLADGEGGSFTAETMKQIRKTADKTCKETKRRLKKLLKQ